MLTIAAMTAVQDVFIIPEGAAGALAELERRKFTAEEGVSAYALLIPQSPVLIGSPGPSHPT